MTTEKRKSAAQIPSTQLWAVLDRAIPQIYVTPTAKHLRHPDEVLGIEAWHTASENSDCLKEKLYFQAPASAQ
jgi:hypothetical protein